MVLCSVGMVTDCPGWPQTNLLLKLKDMHLEKVLSPRQMESMIMCASNSNSQRIIVEKK